MHELIESMLAKSKKVINGRVMYEGEVIQQINKMGVKLHFSESGVRYNF